MDPSRVRPRTVALAVLCLAVIAFGAATLDSTTNPDGGLGVPDQADEPGGEQTPVPDREEPGDTRDGQSSPISLDTGGSLTLCVHWLRTPAVQLGLLAALVGLFLLARWYGNAVVGVGAVVVVAYPGLFLYLLLTACGGEQNLGFPDLSNVGQPAREGGGLVGGTGTVTSPSIPALVLMVLVVGTVVVVAVLVLTGDHDQRTIVEDAAEEEPEPDPATDVAAGGTAAGRAADRLEADGEFENEVYRAWAEMTGHLAVEHPESSTPGEFAAAAVAAGMDEDDVARLTDLFAEVRYGGVEPTPEQETAAVETLRRIETAYAGEES